MSIDDQKSRNHREIFNFLREKFRTQGSFSKAELFSVVPELSTGTKNTYWSKWINNFLTGESGGRFRVAEAFRPYSTWESFNRVATQKRRTYQDYTELNYDNVIIYDFLMPLSNEVHLRTTLDALFYKDTVLARLRAIGYEKVRECLPTTELESQDDTLERACQWVAERFSGYSISHVNGRFRASGLATTGEAANLQKEGGHYLVDETTAIVRFIFCCGMPRHVKVGAPCSDLFEHGFDQSNEDEIREYGSIRWLFRNLFVENILQVVNGEDEIWMVESGVRNRLYRWVVE